MAYTEEQLMGALVPLSSAFLTAEDLSAVAAVYGEMACASRMKIKRIGFVVTVAVAADVTAPVVEFNKRPSLGSSAGEELIGQLTIPDGAAVGQVIYKDVDPVSIGPGEGLAMEHVTQAADSGSAAGSGFYVFECYLDPDYAGNEANMVASA